MDERKKCFRCGNETNDGIDFEMMRVSTWKSGNTKITQTVRQELEGFETHRICESCLQAKLDAIRRPLTQIPEKFKITIFVLLVGVALMISGWETRNNGFIIGVILVAFFILKLIRFITSANKKRENFKKFSENNARFVAAWESFSEVAPRKDSKEHGVFFIPATKATYQMKVTDFTAYYKLTEENARKFYRILREKEQTNIQNSKKTAATAKNTTSA